MPTTDLKPSRGSTTQSYARQGIALTHLGRLEAESIEVMREVIAVTENTVM